MDKNLVKFEFRIEQDELASALLFLRTLVKEQYKHDNYVPTCYYEILGKLYAAHCDLIELKNENTSEA